MRRWRPWRGRFSSRGSWTSTPSVPRPRVTTPDYQSILLTYFPDRFRGLRARSDPGGMACVPIGGISNFGIRASASLEWIAKTTTTGLYPVWSSLPGKMAELDDVTRATAVAIRALLSAERAAYRGVHFCSSPFFVIDTALLCRAERGAHLSYAGHTMSCYDRTSTAWTSGSAIPSTSSE